VKVLLKLFLQNAGKGKWSSETMELRSMSKMLRLPFLSQFVVMELHVWRKGRIGLMLTTVPWIRLILLLRRTSCFRVYWKQELHSSTTIKQANLTSISSMSNVKQIFFCLKKIMRKLVEKAKIINQNSLSWYVLQDLEYTSIYFLQYFNNWMSFVFIQFYVSLGIVWQFY
jgi:hypothetical protein